MLMARQNTRYVFVQRAPPGAGCLSQLAMKFRLYPNIERALVWRIGRFAFILTVCKVVINCFMKRFN